MDVAQTHSDIKVLLRVRSSPPGTLLAERSMESMDTLIAGCTLQKLPDHCSQQQVFEEFQNDVRLAVEHGTEMTILAYGATGSGKTYTINGPLNSIMFPPKLTANSLDQQAGMVQRVAHSLLNQAGKADLRLQVQALFVHDKKVYDLLESKSRHKVALASELILDPTQEGITHKVFEVHTSCSLAVNLAELRSILGRVERNKVVERTVQNRSGSSRGHTIIRLCIEKTSTAITLVDLAGSEKLQTVAVTGKEDLKALQAEGNDIRTSLTHLYTLVAGISNITSGNTSQTSATSSYDEISRLRSEHEAALDQIHSLKRQVADFQTQKHGDNPNPTSLHQQFEATIRRLESEKEAAVADLAALLNLRAVDGHPPAAHTDASSLDLSNTSPVDDPESISIFRNTGPVRTPRPPEATPRKCLSPHYSDIATGGAGIVATAQRDSENAAVQARSSPASQADKNAQLNRPQIDYGSIFAPASAVPGNEADLQQSPVATVMGKEARISRTLSDTISHSSFKVLGKTFREELDVETAFTSHRFTPCPQTKDSTQSLEGTTVVLSSTDVSIAEDVSTAIRNGENVARSSGSVHPLSCELCTAEAHCTPCAKGIVARMLGRKRKRLMGD
ncbi:hypothetical protein P7C73_g1365, partial [Tremellales sp. Uapishka_1]